MAILFRKSLLAVTVASALYGGVTAHAQDTHSSIRGKILDAAGNPQPNATVVVEDQRTGDKRTYSANKSGTFYAAKLSVGGPYIVTVEGREPVVVDYIGVGDIYNLNLDARVPAAEEASTHVLEELVITGSLDVVETSSGPSATFSLTELKEAVSFNRDIKDVYELDPRIAIDDPTSGSAINCAGKHPRFNSVTLDGVSHNDRFGLNANGYSTTTGMPFPYDSIENVSVELAPFDVTYGGFSGCNINAVTKSGTNEWHGNAFFEYTNDSMRGDTYYVNSTQEKYASEPYNERKKGFSIGGPLLEDKLYIFAAYEESVEPVFIAQGYDGSGNGEERSWLSESDFNRIQTIASDIYGYEAGGQPGNGAQEDEKYMVRLDYNINDNHTAALIYNYYNGSQTRASDSDSNEFEFANHFYVQGAESETFTININSQWTDALSTEFYFSSTEMNDSQVTVGDKDFADMQISVGGRAGTVYLGADDSRQSNQLDVTADLFKISAQYLFGDHIITAGFEREELSIFNLFVQHSRGGEYDYFDSSESNSAECDLLTAQGRLDDDTCELSGIDRFELGLPNRIYYGSGGGTNISADAGASFTNALNTFYIQDEFDISRANLSFVMGLRYDYYETDDTPNYNAAFSEASGVRNDATVDGVDILMPRIGVTWQASDQLTVHGGAGLYSGGNPNVWISNAWSNDGLTNVQLQESFDESVFDLDLSGEGLPGFDVPQSMVDQILAVTPEDGSTSNLVILDPDYEQPSEWKYALGGTYNFVNGYVFGADILYAETKNAAVYRDISQSIVGTTAAGQPIYDYTNGEDNYMLTNSSATATSSTFSMFLSKSFDSGFDMTFGYAATNAEDISPMTSSTAGSNFSNVATLDINNLQAGTSNYEVPHRFTMRLSYTKNFFEGLETRINLSGFRQAGQGQSYVMGSGDLEGDGFNGRHLLYVPTGIDDPNVVFGSEFETDAFFSWVESQDLGTGFTKRNGTSSRWSTRFDLRIDQEIPTFVKGTTGLVFLKINNIGNLLNDKWGLQSDAAFFSQQVVDASIDDQGRYVYESFNNVDVNNTLESASVWDARIGFEINF